MRMPGMRIYCKPMATFIEIIVMVSNFYVMLSDNTTDINPLEFWVLELLRGRSVV